MKKIIYSVSLLASVALLFSCGGGTPSSEGGGGSSDNPEVEIKTTERADAGGSGVMLQGFTWSSPNKSRDWYQSVSSNSSQIKNLYEYVWFPPASDSADTTGNGYLPRQLNSLEQLTSSQNGYGSAVELRAAIASIAPAKAIADIVINHRCGTTNYGDFTNPSWDEDFYSICKDDEGFTVVDSGMYGTRKKGAKDTGKGYSAGRDLDHTNLKVQAGIVTWMNDVMKDAGFAGWRYDYVKGYAGNYVGYYNAKTEPVLSVGEYWPDSSYYPSTWANLIENWIKETAQYTNNIAGKPSRAFDFNLKGALNSVFGSGNPTSIPGDGSKDYSMLADSSNLLNKYPGYAVTFVDNHDTGSTQKNWYLNPDGIAPAYAFILTHPGIPCVAWYHYFAAADCPNDSPSQYIGDSTVPGSTLTYKELITKLVELRKSCGITDMSKVTVTQADSTRYYATVNGSENDVLVVIGTALDTVPTDCDLVTSGTYFTVYKK